MKILRISKEEDFLKLKNQWNSLLLDSGLDNIFLTWEWMYNWWRVFKGKKDQLSILLGRNDFAILGIAPFYINRGLYRKIRFLGSGIVSSVHLSFIVSKENKISFSTKVWEYLSKNSTLWNSLSLEGLSSDDGMLPFLTNYVKSKNWRLKTIREYVCYYLPLFSPLEEFKKTVKCSLIKDLKKYKRKLSRKGLIEWKKSDCSNTKGLLPEFEIVVSLHRKRWQALKCKIGGAFSNKLFLKFLKVITEKFYKNKWLNINSVLLNGKTIAVLYCFKLDKKIFAYIQGFDPEYKNCSPGLLCLWDSIQFYIDNGFQEFDLLKGDDNYKQEWTNKFRKEQDVLIVRTGAKGALLLLHSEFLEFTKYILKRVLPPKIFVFLKTLRFNKGR